MRNLLIKNLVQRDHFIFAVLLIIFIGFQLIHIQADFWNDEIYTLKQFTFCSLQNTISDYHVPNNHVLFNLINNIYLKILRLDSIYDLMDQPGILRLIPLIYSIFTFTFFYKICCRFFNRKVAILSLILLTTNIPYFNFALQIRGYGLSQFILLVLIYNYFAFANGGKKKSLFAVVISSALLFYTIPSNLYSLAGLNIATIVAIFITSRGKSTNQIDLVDNSYFKLLMSLLAGIGLGLILYLPILESVFFNKYTVPGSSFQFSKLQYYISNLFYGIVSGRYVIALFFIIGITIGTFRYKKWLPKISLLIAVGFTPIFIYYVRGDQAPIRTLIVLMPIYTILFSLGVYFFWNKLIKTNLLDVSFLTFIALYSGFVFFNQLGQISDKLYVDLSHFGRSQNLYHQYYSAHYQPLADVNSFKPHYDKSNLPVVIIGCEPHGISNYLSKYNIESFPMTKMDSVISRFDSAYIVTNHIKKLHNRPEYTLKSFSSNLTYHNFYIYKKTKPFLEIEEKLKTMRSEYSDSIGYVLNISTPNLLSNFTNSNTSHYISSKKWGDIIAFTHKQPYTCFLSTNNKCDEVIPILQDEHTKIKELVCNDTTRLFIYKLNPNIGEAQKNIFFYDYKILTNLDDSQHWDSIHTYDSKFSERLDSLNEYSKPFHSTMDSLMGYSHLTLSLKSKFTRNKGGFIILDISRGNKNIIWNKFDINKFHEEDNIWHSIRHTFKLPEDVLPSDKIKVFIWNPNNSIFWIDNFNGRLKNRNDSNQFNCN